MPEIYFECERVYFDSSTLLCNLGNDLSSNKPKYALKSSFTVLSNILQESFKHLYILNVVNSILEQLTKCFLLVGTQAGESHNLIDGCDYNCV